jgi:hypothetical protein
MKTLSKKQRLVDYMIASGNKGFTYTEVIKTLLKFQFGEGFVYDRSYRGYYSCAVSGINNYLMNGSGTCGLVKRGNLYFAEYFTKAQRMHRAKQRMQRSIDYAVQYAHAYYPLIREEVYAKKLDRITKNYLRSMKMIDKA